MHEIVFVDLCRETEDLHRALDVIAMTPPSEYLLRALVADPGNPGGCGPFGDAPWPPGMRWETDAEFRDRAKSVLAARAERLS